MMFESLIILVQRDPCLLIIGTSAVVVYQGFILINYEKNKFQDF